MKVKRFYILFMCILLMCTTTIFSFADTYGCVSTVQNADGINYYLEGFEFDSNDTVYVDAFINFTGYTVSLNGRPARIPYNDGFIYTLAPSVAQIWIIYSDEYYIKDNTYIVETSNLVATINAHSKIYGEDSYITEVHRYSSNFNYIDILRDYYGITNLRYSTTDETLNRIYESVTYCNTNNILIERSPEFMAIITAILSVFTAIGDWFVEIIPTILSVFWTPGVDGGEGSLTIIGALAVASLAIAVILLVLRWIVEFFRFRG